MGDGRTVGGIKFSIVSLRQFSVFFACRVAFACAALIFSVGVMVGVTLSTISTISVAPWISMGVSGVNVADKTADVEAGVKLGEGVAELDELDEEVSKYIVYGVLFSLDTSVVTLVVSVGCTVVVVGIGVSLAVGVTVAEMHISSKL